MIVKTYYKINMLSLAIFCMFPNSVRCEQKNSNSVPEGFVLVKNKEAKELLKRSAYAPERKKFELEVLESKHDKLNVRMVSNRPKILAELKIPMKERNDKFVKPTRVIKALGGWVLTYNYGEFGSEAWWFSSDLKTRELLGEKVNGVKVEKEGIAIAFGEINSGKGGIILVKKVNGAFALQEQLQLDWAVFDFSRNIENGLLLLTEIGLILKDDEFMTGNLARCPDLVSDCKTMVLFDDGTIYLGGYLFLRKLNLHSSVVECYAPSADHLRKYRQFPTKLE